MILSERKRERLNQNEFYQVVQFLISERKLVMESRRLNPLSNMAVAQCELNTTDTVPTVPSDSDIYATGHFQRGSRYLSGLHKCTKCQKANRTSGAFAVAAMQIYF